MKYAKLMSLGSETNKLDHVCSNLTCLNEQILYGNQVQTHNSSSLALLWVYGG